jgi:hypothetical protein
MKNRRLYLFGVRCTVVLKGEVDGCVGGLRVHHKWPCNIHNTGTEMLVNVVAIDVETAIAETRNLLISETPTLTRHEPGKGWVPVSSGRIERIRINSVSNEHPVHLISNPEVNQ